MAGAKANRWLIACTTLVALLTCAFPSTAGARADSWRGFNVVTVVNPKVCDDPEAGSDVSKPIVSTMAKVSAAAADGVLRVGVIDSGISAEAGLPVVAGCNYLTDESYSADGSGHGTAVAAIVAAAAPEAELVSLRITAPGAITTAEVAAAAIRGAVDDFACDILLMAFGQSDSLELRQAVEYAAGKGAVLIAAVGNEGQTYRRNKAYYPAGYEHVIGIGATNAQGELAAFSQRAGVSFVCCGEQLPTLSTTGRARVVSGTSFAAAAVAGLAARLQMENADQFFNYLLGVAEDRGAKGYDGCYGYGLIHPEHRREAACGND